MHHANFIKAVRSRKKEDLNCDVAEGVRVPAWFTWEISVIG